MPCFSSSTDAVHLEPSLDMKAICITKPLLLKQQLQGLMPYSARCSKSAYEKEQGFLAPQREMQLLLHEL